MTISQQFSNSVSMSNVTLIDYGCHSFSYRLAGHLHDTGVPVRYFVNGSLESPNLSSLPEWTRTRPTLVRNITCRSPYGKMSLVQRLRGEAEWAGKCIAALQKEGPAAVVVSCIPLSAVVRIESWCRNQRIPFIYWLQDLQGKAIYDLLRSKWGFAGRILGGFAHMWEQELLEKSHRVILIAPGHEQELPARVRDERRYTLLENWAPIEDFSILPPANDWSVRNGLDKTQNVMYTGTLGLKHDLNTFYELASAFKNRSEVRIVVVSTGQAADRVKAEALRRGLDNIVVLPFQPQEEVPSMLAAAAVLIAPLDSSAGSFCVPSKILSYLCAGRPTVIAIDTENQAAKTILGSGAGLVVKPGNAEAFINAVGSYLNDSNVRIEAGRNARRYAEATFRLETVAQKFLNIILSAGVALESDPTRNSGLPIAHSATA